MVERVLSMHEAMDSISIFSNFPHSPIALQFLLGIASLPEIHLLNFISRNVRFNGTVSALCGHFIPMAHGEFIALQINTHTARTQQQKMGSKESQPHFEKSLLAFERP